MNTQEAAKLLNGRQYREEITPAIEAALKGAGLVAVYGASDDLAEFAGAVNDEVGAYDGGEIARFTKAGLLKNDCDDDNCPHFKRAKRGAVPINAVWSEGGYSWRYNTPIPHVKFTIYEDGDTYCEGIVFALADVPA